MNGKDILTKYFKKKLNLSIFSCNLLEFLLEEEMMQQAISLIFSRNFFQESLKIWGASLLIALGAQISIPLPFTPVPITFGLQVLIFLSAILGTKKAFAMIMTYLGQGILGLPVFSKGGFGIAWLLGPTGGYLLGYIFVTLVVARLIEKTSAKKGLKVFCIMLFGNCIAYLFGVPFLARYVGWGNALQCGIIPFIWVDFFKLIFSYHFFVQWNRKGS